MAAEWGAGSRETDALAKDDPASFVAVSWKVWVSRGGRELGERTRLTELARLTEMEEGGYMAGVRASVGSERST